MKVHIFGVLWIGSLCFSCLAQSQPTPEKQKMTICPGLIFQAASKKEVNRIKKLNFSNSEKQYLCGSKDNKAWSKIPWSQRKSFLSPFLESRGYHLSKVKWNPDNDSLQVNLGKQSKSLNIKVKGAPTGFDIKRARRFWDQPLTPKILNGLEEWSRIQLKAMGYACSHVWTSADPLTDTIYIKISPGDVRSVGKIFRNSLNNSKGLLELESSAPERYQAFAEGDIFDGRLLNLTERRSISNGLLINSFFTYNCHQPQLDLHQTNTLGTARTITFGVGVNTEGLLLLKGAFRHNRLDLSGSQFESKIQASFRYQEWDTSYRWFYRSNSRIHFRPRLLMAHANERHFENTVARLQVGPVAQYDRWNGSIEFDVGPVYELSRTFRGEGAEKNRSLQLEAGINYKTHLYEYYLTSPRSGVESGLRANTTDKSFLSTYSAQKITWTGHSLINPGQFDPPIAVLGLRWRLATTITAQSDGETESLPPQMLHYLGGASDARGFNRQELPLGGKPKRSLGYVGFEIRHTPISYENFQPFTFLDIGRLGEKSFQYDKPIYWSPGGGIRLATYFGIIRLTLAKGFIASPGNLNQSDIDKHTHWQAYFSFGEEF